MRDRMKTTHLLPDVMRRMEGSIGTPVGKVKEKLAAEIEAWPCDVSLKRLFQWHWFLKDIEVGPLILSAAHVVQEERQAGNLNRGRLLVGRCANGDEIDLRTKDTAVLYWSHDQALDPVDKRLKEFCVTYESIEYLAIAIWNRAYVPFDSYSAREYFDLFDGR
jgi:hypothetical protein